MKRIKIGQIGIGHNHGEGKMRTVRKFPELFEVIGYAEEHDEWINQRGNLECYQGLPRLTAEEIIAKSDAILVECDVWNLTKTAQMCVNAGKHVHVDKPASGTFEEFQTLIHTAESRKLIVQLGYMYRYNYAVRELMRMIHDGELGEIYQIDAEMSTYHSREYREWLRHFNGGSMYIFGSHLIDLIVSILGEPLRVHPFIRQTGFEGVYSDDNCFAVLEYDKAIARVTNLSVEVNGWGMRRLAVFGSRGTVEIKPLELNVKMTQSTIDLVSNAHYCDIQKAMNVHDVPALSRYDDMMKDFYDCIVNGKENPYPYQHELAVQKTLCRVVGEN